MIHKTFIAMLILICISQSGCSAIPQSDELYDSCRHLKGDEIIIRKLQPVTPGLISGQVAGIINGPIHRVWKVLSDYNRFHEFMPRMPVTYIVTKAALEEINTKTAWKRKAFEKMLEKYRLDTMEGDTVYFYNVVDMPSPVRDRWYLLEMVRDPFSYTVQWKMVTGNMLVNKDSWQLMLHPRHPDKTMAVYTTESYSGIPIPSFIQKFGLNRSLPNIIKGVRKRTREMKLMAADTALHTADSEGER